MYALQLQQITIQSICCAQYASLQYQLKEKAQVLLQVLHMADPIALESFEITQCRIDFNHYMSERTQRTITRCAF